MAQDEQIEKIEEKIEESNTEKAIELVSESDTEIKKHETGEVASNDSSQLEKRVSTLITNSFAQTHV
jgi:hypothetical protein